MVKQFKIDTINFYNLKNKHQSSLFYDTYDYIKEFMLALCDMEYEHLFKKIRTKVKTKI